MKIWFNRNFSSIAFVLSELQKNPAVTTLYSHIRSVKYKNLADEFILEPEQPDNYVEFCLQICQEYNVNIFYPCQHFAKLYPYREQFAELGVRVIFSCSEQNFYILDNKAAFYRQIVAKNLAINVPLFASAHTKAEFIAHYHLLRPQVQKLCMKPTVSIYAAGFKIIHDEPDYDAWQTLLEGGDRYDITYEQLLQVLPDEFEKEIMLLDFLPCDEYSHDLLCWEGRVIAGTIRKKFSANKNNKYQVIVQNAEIERMSKVLVKEFNLNGFINIQYRDDDKGMPFVLEINSRISGGFPMIKLAGIDYVNLFMKLLNQQPINVEEVRQSFSLKIAEQIGYIVLTS